MQSIVVSFEIHSRDTRAISKSAEISGKKLTAGPNAINI
jgi:hypothetical protein